MAPFPEQNREQAWQNLVPPNTSGHEIFCNIGCVFPWHNTQLLTPSNRDKTELWKRLRLDGVVMLLPGQWLQDLPFTPTSSPQHLTENDIKRMKLWASMLENPEFQSGLGEEEQLCSDARLTVRAAQNRIQGNLQDFSEYKVLLSFAAFSLFYGGIHATSWENYFPSEIKADYVANRCLHCYRWRHRNMHSWMHTATVDADVIMAPGQGISSGGANENPSIYRILFGLNIKCLILLSISARLFLVVEVFISIRRLPIAAYDTVNWARFLPHII